MGSSKAPKPPKIEKTIRGGIEAYVGTYGKVLPGVIGLEEQYRPEFLGLNLGDISTFLRGTDGQEGIFGLSQAAQQATAGQLAESRAGELGTAAEQTGMFRQFVEGLSPEQAAAVQMQAREAQRADVASRGLTPQEQRMSQQQAREAYGARGMLGSTGSVVGEALGRENILAAKRQEAAAARGNLFNLASSFYTTPGMAYLTSAPVSYQAGQQTLGLGLGAIGSGVPQMINPDVGANLGIANQQNVTAAQAANAQSSASNTAALTSALGTAAMLVAVSDRRAKTDIKQVGKTNMGLPIYTFKYKGDDMTQMGVMAQDVEKENPRAVKEINGLKTVNYALVR